MAIDKNLDDEGNVVIAVPRWRFKRLRVVEDIATDMAFKYHAWRNAHDRLEMYCDGVMSPDPEEEENLTRLVDTMKQIFEEALADLHAATNRTPISINRTSV